jgi:hypothetical protein
MPTNILYMPAVAMDMTVATNADWLDGLEYWDLQNPAQPIDLSGIEFEMEMRTAPPVATVVLRASTDNGLIIIYSNSWQFFVPSVTMLLVPPGDYVFDLLGRADGYTRSLVQATVTVNLGVTRTDLPPVVAPSSVTQLSSNFMRVTGATVGVEPSHAVCGVNE